MLLDEIVAGARAHSVYRARNNDNLRGSYDSMLENETKKTIARVLNLLIKS